MTALTAGIRRSGRLPKEIPIILSGADAAGRQFAESTRTLVLSLHGATILSRQKLIPEQDVFLRVAASNREIEVRVCGEIGEREDGHIYGVAFADRELDFWRIEFPAAEGLPKNLVSLTLECSGCECRWAVRFDATEIDVYTVNSGLLRYCAQCGYSTIWKIATEPLAPKEPPAANLSDAEPDKEKASSRASEPENPVAANAVPAAASGAPQVNRRSERRTKVKCNAGVRVPGSREEIASCQDMSRGGFSFHSGREYPLETMIEASVPYSPGGIFVPAQIVNVVELQKGKLFRYGAAYLRSSKK